MRPRGFVTAESRALFAKACREGNVAVVRRELEAGTDPNQKDGNGLTALFCAAETGQLAVVQALYECGAAPSKKCAKPPRATPLHIAALNGHTPVVAFLRNIMGSAARADGGTTALHMAAKGGHVAALQLLLPPMQWVKGRWRAPGIVDTVDDLGLTALSHAAMHGHDACVRALLEAGADWRITAPSPSLDLAPETGTSNGTPRSALTIADERKHVEAVALLVNAPAVREEGVRKRNAVEVAKTLAEVISKIPLWQLVITLVDEVVNSEAARVAVNEIEAAAQRDRKRQAAEEAERQRQLEQSRRQAEEAMEALRRKFCAGTYARTSNGELLGVVSVSAAATGEHANMVRLRQCDGSESAWVRLDDPLIKCNKAEEKDYDNAVARLQAERRAIAARALAEKRRAQEAAAAAEAVEILVDEEILWWAERVFTKAKLAAEIKAAEEARRHTIDKCPWGSGCPNCDGWSGALHIHETQKVLAPEPELEPRADPQVLSECDAAMRIQAVQRGRVARRQGDIDARALLLRGLPLVREIGQKQKQRGLELAALRTLAHIEDRLANHVVAEQLHIDVGTALRQEYLFPEANTTTRVSEHQKLHRSRRRCDLDIRTGIAVLLQVRDIIDAAEKQAAQETEEAQRLLLAASSSGKRATAGSSTTRQLCPISVAERRRQRRLRMAYSCTSSDAPWRGAMQPGPRRPSSRRPRAVPPVHIHVGLSSTSTNAFESRYCSDLDVAAVRRHSEPSCPVSSSLLPSFRADRLLNLREKAALERRAAVSR